MLKLVAYQGAFGEPSGSPFCVKAMCLLQMSGLDWQPDYQADPRKSPKGKFPLLIDGAETIADSDQIRDHLEEKYSVDFDGKLSSEQKAIARAVARMMEEHFYFYLMCDRWEHEGNWERVKEVYFGAVPAFVRPIVSGMVRRQALKQAWEQGARRHSIGERLVRTNNDLAAVRGILGKKKFLFGSEPTAADATVAPFLSAAALAPVPTGLSKAVNENKVLMDYVGRGREAFYPTF